METHGSTMLGGERLLPLWAGARNEGCSLCYTWPRLEGQTEQLDKEKEEILSVWEGEMQDHNDHRQRKILFVQSPQG